MSKVVLTKKLSEFIVNATNKLNTFGCTEVTIGIGGSERVDYMTYDTKGVFRCYEIKSSKEDFYSKAKWSFVGHYNYFVMTGELYEQVYQDVPAHIGVYIGDRSSAYPIKRATKQESVQVDVLKDSLIRSLSREFKKSFRSSDVEEMNQLEKQVRTLTVENRSLYKKSRTANALFTMLRRGYTVEEMRDYVKNVGY